MHLIFDAIFPKISEVNGSQPVVHENYTGNGVKGKKSLK